jgi:hypothetical protein
MQMPKSDSSRRPAIVHAFPADKQRRPGLEFTPGLVSQYLATTGPGPPNL